MGCGCGGGGLAATVAYRMNWTDSDGQAQVGYAETLGAYSLLRQGVESAGGTVVSGAQVPRSEYDAWAAAQ